MERLPLVMDRVLIMSVDVPNEELPPSWPCCDCARMCLD